MKSFHAFLIILSLTVVLGGAFTRNESPGVLSETTEGTATPQSTITPIPTTAPITTSTPKPTPEQITQNTPMLVFPGAKIISQTSSQTIMTTSANPGDVAKWYRDELRELGMNATASSQNNINGNFSAKISAADPEVKYDIEIKKAATDSETTIIFR